MRVVREFRLLSKPYFLSRSLKSWDAIANYALCTQDDSSSKNLCNT